MHVRTWAGRTIYVIRVALVLVLGVFVCVVVFGEVITLRAEEQLGVGRSPIRPPSGSNLVYTMAPGERADVIECEDVKHYIVVRVRVRSGDTGYPDERPERAYTLERHRAGVRSLWRSPGRIIFSCRGMFKHQSVYLP